MDELKSIIRRSKPASELKKCLETLGSTVHLEQMVGGAYSLYAATTVERVGGVHIFLADDRDSAAYLVNDLYELLDEERVVFFSSGYKRSPVYGGEDAQGVVRRTAALNAIASTKACQSVRSFSKCVAARLLPCGISQVMRSTSRPPKV